MSRSSGLAFARRRYPNESKTGDSEHQTPSGAQCLGPRQPHGAPALGQRLHQVAQGLDHATLPFGTGPQGALGLRGHRGRGAEPMEGHVLAGQAHRSPDLHHHMLARCDV